MLKYTKKKQGTQPIEQIKVLTFAGLPPHKGIKLDCLLGEIDCLDRLCNIYSNIKVDGNPILKEALFQNIPHCASTLTLEWLAKSHDRHVWKDSQTITILNVAINGIKNAPSTKDIIPDRTIHAYSNFNFSLGGLISFDSDGDSFTLNVHLNHSLPESCWQSFDPTIIVNASLR
ncbi:MAG: hypothetical protein AAF915_04340 [Cyanobacteria bacterium P01_D01_bin.50]